MAKERRDNGTGTIYQRENGTWQGKLYLGRKADGSPKFKYVSGKTKAEVKRKICDYNYTGSEMEKKIITVEEYFMRWLKTYKRGTIKESSYDAREKTIQNHIIPYIGNIQFQQLSSDDIQGLLVFLKEEKNYSHSTVKKVYDYINPVIKFALIKKDITENPMLVVNMPEKSLFEKKEIRFFNRRECALIIEECGRVYSTGKPVYVYADAYILMLNTGIRMGEAIGLEKSDWDRQKKVLHMFPNTRLRWSVEFADEI